MGKQNALGFGNPRKPREWSSADVCGLSRAANPISDELALVLVAAARRRNDNAQRRPVGGTIFTRLSKQYSKRRLSWLKNTNLKHRTDERQNTQREKHATAQRQRAHDVNSSHAARASGAPFAAHPAPNLAGRTCRELLYVPRGVSLDIARPTGTAALDLGLASTKIKHTGAALAWGWC